MSAIHVEMVFADEHGGDRLDPHKYTLFTYFIYIEILMHITYLLAGHTIVQNYGKLLTYVPISQLECM